MNNIISNRIGFYFCEAFIWWVVFVLCGSPVNNVLSITLTIFFGALLAVTMPMKWMDIRQTVDSNVSGVFIGENYWKKREELNSALETFFLLTAILFGASFTQLDWNEWFLLWPLPAIVTFISARVAFSLVKVVQTNKVM